MSARGRDESGFREERYLDRDVDHEREAALDKTLAQYDVHEYALLVPGRDRDGRRIHNVPISGEPMFRRFELTAEEHLAVGTNPGGDRYVGPEQVPHYADACELARGDA